MRILGSRSGFKTARDLLSYTIGLGGLIFVLTRKDGASNYPGITIFLGFIGAPYIFQRDERRNGDEEETADKPPTKAVARKRTATKKGG